jgi:hypothetical protein
VTPRHGKGCTCKPCPAAKAAEQRHMDAQRRNQRVEVDGRLVAPLPADRHGRPGTYNNWGCRCEPCTEAHRNRQRRDRAKARERDRQKRAQLARQHIRQLTGGRP